MKDKYLEKFVNDNFNLKYFDVELIGDYIVTITDHTGDKLSIIHFPTTDIVDCFLNGSSLHKYRLRKFFDGTDGWEVLSNTYSTI